MSTPSPPQAALIEKVRKEIRPAAADLAERIDALHAKIDGQGATVPDQLRQDADKLREDAGALSREIDRWFPPAAELDPGTDLDELVRNSRHDARNQLNHLFGVVQLVQMTGSPEGCEDILRDISSELQRCLSIVSQKASESASVVAHRSGESIPIVSRESGLLLIADDDPFNRDILARLLRPHGFELEFAENGRAALDKIDAQAYDAVLLDIQMPEMDGFEVLDRMKERGHLRHTPVIVVTGFQDEQDAVRCIEIGAEDFLSRPIRPALLMARLNASLEKKRLREKVFEQHFTPELARELARNPDPMQMKARQAEVTVLFCDIRNFSAISERLGPSQTVDWLSGIMGDFSASVIDHGGVLVDYTGDELLAMWGAPSEQPDHADLACDAAREILGSLPGINRKWRDTVGAETEVGIGINTGDALVGNVGTRKKFKYGPLGTTVNLASRVQGATKYLSTPLLITDSTHDRLSDVRNTRRLCQVRVQNIQQPVGLHQLVSNDQTGIWHTLTDHYEEALDHFEAGEFQQASALLGELLVETPDDGPSLLLISRVVEAMLGDGENFSPIWDLPGK